jgi:hypothetical protein
MTDIAATPRPSSGFAALLRHGRYVIAENRVTGFAFGLFLLIVLAAVFGPYIVPHDPLASDTAAALKPPSMKHWFGTDQIGRDVLSRVIYGSRASLTVAMGAVLFGTTLGALWGLASGFLGGRFDIVSQRIIEFLQSFPDLILAMAISMALGTGHGFQGGLAVVGQQQRAFLNAEVLDNPCPAHLNEIRRCSPVQLAYQPTQHRRHGIRDIGHRSSLPQPVAHELSRQPQLGTRLVVRTPWVPTLLDADRRVDVGAAPAQQRRRP